MSISDEKLTLRVIGLGSIAGMRSMSAPLLAATYLRQQQPPYLEESRFAWLASPLAVNLLRLLAAGELAADKLPQIPARTEPVALLGRTLSGGLVGAALSAAHGRSPLGGAALGSLAAVAATLGAYHLRKALVEQLELPDPMVALLEDALVIGGGSRLLEVGSPLKLRLS